MLDLALDSAVLTPGDGKDASLEGVPLRALCTEYFSVESAITRMSRRYQTEVLWELARQKRFHGADLVTQEKRESLAGTLAEALNTGGRSTGGPTYRVSWDLEGATAALVVDSERHGRYRQSRFTGEFFESTEYESLSALGERLRVNVGSAPKVRRGQREQQETGFSGALAWLMKEARRGLSIQRYKGLGEMNPEQLWETTMDASQRRLSQVQIEDAVSADEIFTVLMGDEVQPRRKFIQRNAFSVNNLDV